MDIPQDQYKLVRHLIYTRTGRQITWVEYQRICAILDELVDLTGATSPKKFLTILTREPNSHRLWQYIIAQLDGQAALSA